MSHREEPFCRLLVPSLPSVSLLFSSWPAGQESFVEGTRKRSGWTCLDTPPLWTSRQTPAQSQGQAGGLAWGGE